MFQAGEATSYSELVKLPLVLLTVLKEFKLRSMNRKFFCSLKVPGGIDVIPFRLRSKICSDFSDWK